MPSVSLVLPLVEPIADLTERLGGWASALREAAGDFEILLIDDGARSASTEIWPRDVPGLHIIHHPAPLGVGGSLQTGIEMATKEWILATPADGTIPPTAAKKLLDAAKDVSMVVGYRQDRPLPGWLKALDLGKRIVSRVLLGDMPEPRDTWMGGRGLGRRWLARHIFGVHVRDPECGLFLAKRECFAQMRIQSKGTFAWVETIAKANHLGLLIAETPVESQAARAPMTFGRDALDVFRKPEFGWR